LYQKRLSRETKPSEGDARRVVEIDIAGKKYVGAAVNNKY
jgi:hypothetical protein